MRTNSTHNNMFITISKWGRCVESVCALANGKSDRGYLDYSAPFRDGGGISNSM